MAAYIPDDDDNEKYQIAFASFATPWPAELRHGGRFPRWSS